MNWDGILGSAGQQNAIFWGGAAAVALGGALLVATLVARVRDRLRRPLALPRFPANRAAAAYGAASAATPPPIGRPSASHLSGAPPAAPPADPEGVVLAAAAHALAATSSPPAPSLAILLRRLQLAGDRLEEVARGLDADDRDPDEALAATAEEVEYVFKACSP